MKNSIIISIIFSLFIFLSCEKQYVLDILNNNSDTLASNTLSSSEIIDGLKTALIVGTDSSSSRLNITDGYFADAAVKILLPPEANVIVENISSVSGGPALVQKVILSINRAAEDAADDASPIFKNAITSLSISQAWDILNGVNPAGTKSTSTGFDSTAATNYFNSVTRNDLVTVFAPKMNEALDKDLIGLGYSANDAWNDLSTAYNTIASIPFSGLTPVNTNLGTHCTNKALDGLFLKVGEQEKKIRENPFSWAATAVGNILARVFGRL